MGMWQTGAWLNLRELLPGGNASQVLPDLFHFQENLKIQMFRDYESLWPHKLLACMGLTSTGERAGLRGWGWIVLVIQQIVRTIQSRILFTLSNTWLTTILCSHVYNLINSTFSYLICSNSHGERKILLHCPFIGSSSHTGLWLVFPSLSSLLGGLSSSFRAQGRLWSALYLGWHLVPCTLDLTFAALSQL